MKIVFLSVVHYFFPLAQVWIWDYYGHRKHALMQDMGKTLDDANIQMDQDVGLLLLCSLCLSISFHNKTSLAHESQFDN